MKFRSCAIHGNKKQFQRQSAIQNFTNGHIPILIATDVASRGLDFPNVNYVINYDLPKNLEDYIHRIGRTGRMGQQGTAISLINETNKPIIRKLYQFFKSQNQQIPPWFDEMYYNELNEEKIKKFTKNNNNNNNYPIYNNKPTYNTNMNMLNYDTRNNTNSYYPMNNPPPQFQRNPFPQYHQYHQPQMFPNSQMKVQNSNYFPYPNYPPIQKPNPQPEIPGAKPYNISGGYKEEREERRHSSSHHHHHHHHHDRRRSRSRSGDHYRRRNYEDSRERSRHREKEDK